MQLNSFGAFDKRLTFFKILRNLRNSLQISFLHSFQTNFDRHSFLMQKVPLNIKNAQIDQGRTEY